MAREGRVVSRLGQIEAGRNFTDISIDSRQPVRSRLGLLNYIPMFPGFYSRYRGYELNGFLMSNYDEPKVQNKSFYGTFNKVLQFKDGMDYEKVLTLLINDEVVYRRAEEGRVRFFDDIAVKPNAIEVPIANRRELTDALMANISGADISGEVDLLDDGTTSVSFPTDIEAIVVDSERIGLEVGKILRQYSRVQSFPKIFVSEHPRNDPGVEEF